MSPRTGRPKAESPKNIRYSIRLDEKTEERLRKYCDKYSVTRGEAIRRAIDLLLKEKE